MKDKIILTKIKSYLIKVERFFEVIKNLNEKQIVETDESLALTQCLINIHGLSRQFSSDEIAEKMFQVTGRGLDTCRNISAHDYDSLDWDRVKALCKRLLSEKSMRILEDCFKLVEKDESGQKDYSKSTVFNKPK